MVRWIGSPRSGVVVVIVALGVYAWLQLRKEPKANPVTLVGKFFHTFQPGENTWQYQGQVLREENGRLFVQLYEPMLGEASTQQFLTQAQADSARFYDSEDEWRDEGYRMNRKAFGDRR